MRTFRALAFPVLIAALSACSDREERPAASGQPEAPAARVVRATALPEAPPADTLRIERALGDSLDFADITGVYPIGRHLLVSDRLMNYHLALVDLAADSVVAHFGKHGEGPGEFSSISSVIQANRTGDQVWLYDFTTRRFTRLGLSDPTRPAVLETVQSRIDASLLEPVMVDDQVVSNVLSADGVLLFARADGTQMRLLGADLAFDARTMPHPVGRRLLNRTYLARNPGTGQLAILYQFANRLDVYDAEGRRQVTAHGPREHRAVYRVERDRFFWQPENVMTYAGVAATPRFIYALYCGCAMRDNGLPARLHVFRWDGGFVSEVAFDRPVQGLAVPPGDSIVYSGTSEPHPLVGSWRLPGHLARADVR